MHRFSPGADGWSPGVSAYKNGTLYGYTEWGGNKSDGHSEGCGVVFAISASTGKETVLYRFSGGVRGAFQSSNLLRSTSESVLYGATELGGYRNAGHGLPVGLLRFHAAALARHAREAASRFHEKADFVKADVAARHVQLKQFVSPRFHTHSAVSH
ncbi:MAG: hypothetical protein WBE79_04805, partial [Candidatus Cybelea sp.]